MLHLPQFLSQSFLYYTVHPARPLPVQEKENSLILLFQLPPRRQGVLLPSYPWHALQWVEKVTDPSLLHSGTPSLLMPHTQSLWYCPLYGPQSYPQIMKLLNRRDLLIWCLADSVTFRANSDTTFSTAFQSLAFRSKYLLFFPLMFFISIKR